MGSFGKTHRQRKQCCHVHIYFYLLKYRNCYSPLLLLFLDLFFASRLRFVFGSCKRKHKTIEWQTVSQTSSEQHFERMYKVQFPSQRWYIFARLHALRSHKSIILYEQFMQDTGTVIKWTHKRGYFSTVRTFLEDHCQQVC